MPRRKRTLTRHFHGCNRFWHCRLRYPTLTSSFQQKKKIKKIKNNNKKDALSFSCQPFSRWVFFFFPGSFGLRGWSLKARFRFPLATEDAGSQKPPRCPAQRRESVPACSSLMRLRRGEIHEWKRLNGFSPIANLSFTSQFDSLLQFSSNFCSEPGVCVCVYVRIVLFKQ